MTVNTNISTASYAGNGSTTSFPVPFYFLVDTDISVLHKTAAGVTAPWVLNSDYTLSGAGVEAGGTIIPTAVLPQDDVIYLARDVDIVQQTEYPVNSAFPAASHEKALDRLTMIAQQLQTADQLTLTRDPLGNTYDLANNTLINSADAVSAQDVPNLGQVETLVAGAASGIIPDNIALKTDLAAYVAISAAAGTSTGMGSDLVGYVDPLSAAATTVSDIINGERVSVLRVIDKTKWSAVRAGTDTTDWAPAINALLTAMGAAGHGHLYFPAGSYGLGAELIVPSNVTIEGVRGKTWLFPVYDPVGGNLLLSTSGQSFVTIRGMGFDGRMATRGVANFVNVVTIYQSSDVVLEDCNWKDCKGISAIFSSDVARSGVRRGNLSNCGTYQLTSLNSADRRQAIAFTSGTQANNLFNFVEDTHLRDIGLDCISIGNQTHFSAQRNKINRNYAGSIYDTGSVYTNVVGNHIANSGGNAIDVNGSDYGVYANNVIHNSTAAGVMLGGALVDAVVSGNVIRAAMQDSATLHKGAITLDASAGTINHVTVVGNVCEGNLGWGFYVRPGYNPGGSIHCPAEGNVFANNTLGDASGLDSAYVGSAGGKVHTVAAGASIPLMPAVGGGVGNYARIDVVDASTSQLGSFLARGASTMQILQDLSTGYSATDTGTTTAVFYDSVSGNILLKNKSAGSKTYRIKISGIAGA